MARSVAIRHWRNPIEARRIADLQSRTTHYSELSAAACAYLVAVQCELISGRDWKDALRVEINPDWPEEIQLLAGENWQSRERESISSTGFVVHTLEAALWAVDTTDCFAAAVLKAVNLGDDADSVGAVAGQLAGARYGFGEIPTNWRDALIDGDRIANIAQSLFEASEITSSDISA